MFNMAICQGFPPSWCSNVIVSITEDPLDPSNYRTILIGHLLAKLCESILEFEVNTFANTYGYRARGSAHFQRTYSTFHHIFSHYCGGSIVQVKILLLLSGLPQDFMVLYLKACLLMHLQELALLVNMIWGVTMSQRHREWGHYAYQMSSSTPARSSSMLYDTQVPNQDGIVPNKGVAKTLDGIAGMLWAAEPHNKNNIKLDESGKMLELITWKSADYNFMEVIH